MEMLLTGDTISAQRAANMGLVNRVVPPMEIEQTSMKMAKKIASKSGHTLALGKRAFYQQKEMGLAEAYEYASEVMVKNMMSVDAAEGISAFIEKRTPNWRNG